LEEYLRDPDAHDNRGLLRKRPQNRELIIRERKEHLEDEIKAFRDKIKENSNTLGKRKTS
jgi:hypothetical protein